MTARKKADADPDAATAAPPPEKMSFEQAIEELEAIVERIEQGEIGLEDALAQRRRGDALIKRCRTILDTAEQELKSVSVDDASGGGVHGGGDADET